MSQMEKEMAMHSSILAWIPCTEKSGRLHPWGCKQSDMTEDINSFISPSQSSYQFVQDTWLLSPEWA